MEEFLSPLLLILSDIKAAMAELRPLDFLPLIVWSLWVIVLMASLKRIDLRDDLTQASYIAVISAIGLIMIAGVPFALGKPFSLRQGLVIFVCFVIAARVRWRLATSTASQSIAVKAKSLEKK